MMETLNKSCMSYDFYSFLFINIQGLNSKVDVLESYVFENPCDFICVTEHWMNEHAIAMSGLNNFSIIDYYQRNHFKHGGVLIYASKNIACTRIDLSMFCVDKHFEACALRVNVANLIVVVVYRTPDSNEWLFLDLLEKVLHFFMEKWSKCKVIIGGDINSQFDVTKDKRSVKEFLNLLRQFDFYCHNKQPTRNNSCLDNIFSNLKTDDVGLSVEAFPFSDHSALRFRIALENVPTVHSLSTQPKFVNRRIFKRSSIIRFRESLAGSNFMSSLDYVDIGLINAESLFDQFFYSFMYCFNLSFPLLRVKYNGNKKSKSSHDNSWYTDELRNKKSILMLVYEMYKSNRPNSLTYKNIYLRLKYKYKQSVKEAKLNFNAHRIESSANKCKAAWSIIKKVDAGKVNSQYPNVNPSHFNKFCIDSVTNIRNIIVKPPVLATDMCKNKIANNVCFNWKTVSVSDIRSVIEKMKITASQDYYGLSSKLLKDIKEDIVEPLALCTNFCMEQGIFPNCLKISKVIPVYKKGDRTDLANYRPISLVPVLGKVIEHVVCNQVSNYFETLGLFENCQFGFRRGCSTMNAIDAMLRDILGAFERKNYAWGTFCDLSKAFDCVDHGVLISKFEHYGIRGPALNFFVSYLQNRRQAVCVDGEWSPVLGIDCGVPQGSVLGPLLFLIAINDLPSNISRVNTYMFADDTSFLSTGVDLEYLHGNVMETMTSVKEWFSANSFLLNESKTKSVIFGLRQIAEDIIGPTEDHVKFLGIVLDSKLSWNQHVDKLATRLSRIVFLLRRLVNLVPSQYAITAYYALFQSVVGYGLIFWGNAGGLRDILVLQKKVVRILTNSPPMTHCKPLFTKLGILTVTNLYIFNLLIYIFKDLNTYRLRNHVHNIHTRHNNLLDLPFVRLEKTRSSHVIMSIKLFNRLPAYARSLSFNAFKSRMYKWLSEHPFYCMDEFWSLDTSQILI